MLLLLALLHGPESFVETRSETYYGLVNPLADTKLSSSMRVAVSPLPGTAGACSYSYIPMWNRLFVSVLLYL